MERRSRLVIASWWRAVGIGRARMSDNGYGISPGGINIFQN